MNSERGQKQATTLHKGRADTRRRRRPRRLRLFATATAATPIVAMVAVSASNADIFPTEGQAFSGAVVTSTCARPPTSPPTIDWGDGTTTGGTFSSGEVDGTHTYAAAGLYQGKVSYAGADSRNCPGPDTFTASVSDATVAANSINFNATQGQQFRGVVATFTDADPGATAADFSATVNWFGTSTPSPADGKAVTISPAPGGGFTVSATHTFTTTGTGELSVTINDTKPQGGTGGQSASRGSAFDTVTLAKAPPAFRQCPAVGLDTGCQFLIVVSNGKQQILNDPYQTAYEGDDDTLIGVVNNSSKPISALPLSAPHPTGPPLFGFENDGICNNGSGPVPAGCVPAKHAARGTKCGVQSGSCSFSAPPGQPLNHQEAAHRAGNTQNGYEGPTSWYSNISRDETRGHVNFSPPLQPGQATYFSLEEPPTTTDLATGKPTQQPPLPAPVVGKVVNAAPVSGIVFVKVPGRGGFVPLTEARQLLSGTEVDAVGGSFTLVTSAGTRGRTQTGTFSGGVFKITQLTKGPQRGLTTLELLEGLFKGAPSFAQCKAGAAPDSPSASSAGVSRRILQTLKSNVHGRFRTKGRFAAATVRGTQWIMEDRCDGTWTNVLRGSVTVQDFVRHKTVLVRAHHIYLALAQPPKGRKK